MVELPEGVIEAVEELSLEEDEELVEVDIESCGVPGPLERLHELGELLVYLTGDGLLRGVGVGDVDVLLRELRRGDLLKYGEFAKALDREEYREGPVHKLHELRVVRVQQRHEHHVAVQVVVLAVDEGLELD